MHVFNSIIFNLLALRKTVIIPGIGTLGIEHSEARLKEDTLDFPSNDIIYSGSEEGEGVNMINYIVGESGLERSDVEHAFKRWLSDIKGVSGENEIFIEGVCSIQLKKDGSYTIIPCENINDILNPLEQEAIRMGRLKKKTMACDRNYKRRVIWGTIAIVLAVGIFAVYMTRDKFADLIRNARYSQQVESLKDSPSSNTLPAVVSEPVVEEITIETNPGEAVVESTVSTDTPAEITEEPEALIVNSSPSKNYHYIIAGVFSTQENAQRYIEQKRDLSSAWEIVMNSQGKYMASVRSFLNGDDAARERLRLKDDLPGTWIYKRSSN